MKAPMLFALLSFTQILLIAVLPFAAADLVDDTCKKSPFTNFCVSALRSDPRSSAADTKSLGLIMVDKANFNAKSARTKIEDMLRKAPDPQTRPMLAFCEQLYKTIISDLVPPSKEGLTKGDYGITEEYMKGAANLATQCETYYGGSNSPISDLNYYEHKAATVASAIAGLLL